MPRRGWAVVFPAARLGTHFLPATKAMPRELRKLDLEEKR
jgi:UTP-glucose-1-phosphate uridylyltransferase